MKTCHKVLLGIAVIGLVVAAIITVWGVRQLPILKQALESPKEAYAVQHTAELVIAYLKTHHNQWPPNWAELRTAMIRGQESLKESKQEVERYSAYLDEIEQMVYVDFTVTTEQLTEAIQSTSAPPFNVIRLRNGRNTHWSGLEPNELVAAYLRNTQ